jgi:hypothetical protein
MRCVGDERQASRQDAAGEFDDEERRRETKGNL